MTASNLDTHSETRYWKRSQEILAYGQQHRMLLRPLYAGEESVYPRFAEHASGCELIDGRGRSFIDWLGGCGPLLLGYRHPKVEQAIRDQLEAGPTLSLMHRVEVDVAEMLVEMIPCAEMVAFGKNGSDALTAAVRAARAYTGREILLHHGFHGFHDWYVSRDPDLPGVPRATTPLIHSFPYNDLGALEALLDRHRGRVAAVLMEPTNTRLPEPGFLEGVRDLAHHHGALLIFDEVITGFRLARGGAQERFGVTPDIACFGKAIANGMPLSAVVGRRRYLRVLPNVAYGMTFRGETLSFAAARAVLEVLREEPVVEHVTGVGREVREAFHAACAARGIQCELLGPEPRMSFDFARRGDVSAETIQTMFLRECARHGILTSGILFASYAHDAEAVRRTIEALEKSLDVLAQTSDRSDTTNPMLGLKGYIDLLDEEPDGHLRLHGWLLVDDRVPDRVEIVASSGETRQADAVPRPDVAKLRPVAQGADRCGYTARLSPELFARHGEWEFEVRPYLNDRPIGSVFVSHRADRSESDGPFEITQGLVIS